MHQRQYRNKVFATMQSSGWMALQSGQQRRRSEQGRVTFEVATRIEWFGKFENSSMPPDQYRIQNLWPARLNDVCFRG
jgi:hypothetical protein